MTIVTNKYLLGAGMHALALLSLAGAARIYQSSIHLLLMQALLSFTCIVAAALFFLVGTWKLLRKNWHLSILLIVGAGIQIIAVVVAQGFLNPIAE